MKAIKIARVLFAHAAVILALCFVMFWILDWYNPMMAFTAGAAASPLLPLFCASAAITAVLSLFLPSGRASR